MGEALFDLVLAELRGQGSEGPPHRIPDLFFAPYSQPLTVGKTGSRLYPPTILFGSNFNNSEYSS